LNSSNDYSKIFSSLLTESKGGCDNRDFSDPNFGDEVMESENLHFQKMSTRFQLFAKQTDPTTDDEKGKKNNQDTRTV
jgi:hypothetical protein